MSYRITSLTAYTQVGDDDEEGVCAFLSGDIWMPMVAADAYRLRQLRDMAQMTANVTGKPVQVRRFETAVEVETLEPKT